MKVLILAGGKSRRMGRIKALIKRPDGTRQLDHILGLARAVAGGEILISTNDPSIAPAGIGALPDLRPGDGPLGALASFHAAHPASPVLVIGCDLFLLDEATLRHLLDRHEPSHAATCFANRIDGRPEPLCAIYEGSSLAKAADSLANGEHCVRHFLEFLKPKVLDLASPAALDNANTPAELDEAFAKITCGVSRKSVTVRYSSKLREARGLDEEHIPTLACTAAGLYEELRFRHRLPPDIDSIRPVLNGSSCSWTDLLNDNNLISFVAHSPADSRSKSGGNLLDDQ